jgi:APA family basic amino acid/polyamine antiporter
LVGIAAGQSSLLHWFDAVSTAAQEAKNPQKRDAKILGSLVICTILYVLFAHVMTGLVPYYKFGWNLLLQHLQ